MKTHVDKPSYASSSSHAQECDDIEETELRRSKRVRKKLTLVKISLPFLLVMTLSLIKRLSPFWMLNSGKRLLTMN